MTTSFDTTGYVVMRAAFDAASLAPELDRALDEGVGRRGDAQVGDAGIAFRYVPMMCEWTPVSLALIDTMADTIAELVGRPVLPGRAKATEYTGDSALHTDSDRDIASIGCLAYLEPLDAASGALQVVPRSGDAPAALPTAPGDMIVFDERCTHGSSGGGTRRQWRVDFIVDPRDAAEEQLVRAWYASVFPSDAPPPYDAERYPSFGPYWQTRDRPWTDRLRQLGVYDLARGH